jgi:hypothetical protein
VGSLTTPLWKGAKVAHCIHVMPSRESLLGKQFQEIDLMPRISKNQDILCFKALKQS